MPSLIEVNKSTGERLVVGESSSRRASSTYYVTELDASTSVMVSNTGMRTDRVRQESNTAHPSSPALAAGDLWYRSDLKKMYYHDGTNPVELGSGAGIADPATKVTNDILQYTGSSWDAKGAASGDRLSGPIYASAMDLAGHLTFTADNSYDIGASGATRPRTGYFGTSVIIAGKTAMKADDSTGGDLSGTYPTTLTVAKVQNISWLSGTPTDRQMPTYDSGNSRWEYQWPGITNPSEGKTFTILPAGSTVATINTALTDYDTVYLEPGSYSMGNGDAVAIGAGKALIGLGNSWGNGSGAKFTATVATGGIMFTLNNGYLKNISVVAASAQAHDVIYGNNSDFVNFVEQVAVEQTATASGIFGIVGTFVSVNTVRLTGINGMYLAGTSVTLFGPTRVANFRIYNAPTYGITIACGHVRIENGNIDGNSKTTDYGILYSNSTGYDYHWVSGVAFYNCGYGICYTYTTNRPWRVHISECLADNCTIGFYLYGPADLTVSNTWAASCTQRGFQFQDVYYGTVTGCVSRANKSTAGTTYGNFYAYGCFEVSFTGLSSQDASNASGNSGLYLGACERCAVSGLASQYDYVALYLNGCNHCSVSTVTSHDSPGYACYFYNCDNITGASLASYSSVGYGILISTCDICSFSALTSHDDGAQGIYVTVCTRVSIAGASIYSAGSDGFYASQCDYCAWSSITSSNNAGDGFEFNGQHFDYCAVSTCSAYGNGGYGFTNGNVGLDTESVLCSCEAGGNSSGGYYMHGDWYTSGNRG